MKIMSITNVSLYKWCKKWDMVTISFRYPTDRDNQPCIDPFEAISLVKVEELFNKSMILLEYTPSVLGEYIAAVMD